MAADAERLRQHSSACLTQAAIPCKQYSNSKSDRIGEEPGSKGTTTVPHQAYTLSNLRGHMRTYCSLTKSESSRALMIRSLDY